MTPEQFIQTNTPLFLQIRRKLHQIPEPGTKETKTGKAIMALLDDWGIPYQFPVADTGIAALIKGTKEGTGNVAALRADMDALPLTEPSDISCRSLHPGMMHACGHDVHMTIALGAALYFQTNRQAFCGCVKILFQPAEETVGGARRMVEQGCMENPHVDYVTGLHVAPGLSVGEVEVKYGKMYAASDEVRLILHGKSCHGAYPDTGIDAIVMAGALVSSLQSIVSRNVSPLDQAVLTLGRIHGGYAHNIVADRVEITGALRTTDPVTRQKAKKIIIGQTRHVSAAFGGTGEALITPGYNALVNSDAIVDVFLSTAETVVGKEKIHMKSLPGMGVEDFSFFLDKAPGVFYHLGCGNKEKGITAPLHSDAFAVDEACIPLGIRLQILLTMELLKKDKG